MTYFLAGLLQGLFWFVVLGTALWVIRRIAPSLEVPLLRVNFLKGTAILIRRLVARVRGFRALPPDREGPAREE